MRASTAEKLTPSPEETKTKIPLELVTAQERADITPEKAGAELQSNIATAEKVSIKALKELEDIAWRIEELAQQEKWDRGARDSMRNQLETLKSKIEALHLNFSKEIQALQSGLKIEAELTGRKKAARSGKEIVRQTAATIRIKAGTTPSEVKPPPIPEDAMSEEDEVAGEITVPEEISGHERSIEQIDAAQKQAAKAIEKLVIESKLKIENEDFAAIKDILENIADGNKDIAAGQIALLAEKMAGHSEEEKPFAYGVSIQKISEYRNAIAGAIAEKLPEWKNRIPNAESLVNSGKSIAKSRYDASGKSWELEHPPKTAEQILAEEIQDKITFAVENMGATVSRKEAQQKVAETLLPYVDSGQLNTNVADFIFQQDPELEKIWPDEKQFKEAAIDIQLEQDKKKRLDQLHGEALAEDVESKRLSKGVAEAKETIRQTRKNIEKTLDGWIAQKIGDKKTGAYLGGKQKARLEKIKTGVMGIFDMLQNTKNAYASKDISGKIALLQRETGVSLDNLKEWLYQNKLPTEAEVIKAEQAMVRTAKNEFRVPASAAHLEVVRTVPPVPQKPGLWSKLKSLFKGGEKPAMPPQEKKGRKAA